MLVVYALIVILFGTVIAIRIQTGIAIAEFTRDPLGFTGIPVYTGSISNLGVLIWSAAAAICFFSYGLMRSQVSDDQRASFLLASGVITTVLVLDDLYMLHEVVFPENLGIPQNLVYITYAAAILWFLIAFRATILRTSFLILLLALMGFAVSVVSDFIAPMVSIPGMYLFEDGGKFFGIVNWTAYFVLVAAQFIRSGEHHRSIAD